MSYMKAALDRRCITPADQLPGAVDRAIRGLLLRIADLAAACGDEVEGSFTPLDAIGMSREVAEVAYGAANAAMLAEPIGYACYWTAVGTVICELHRGEVVHTISWLDSERDLQIPWLIFPG